MAGAMFNKILFLFVLCFLLANKSQAKSWRGIVPLKSTRADVERVLGSGSGECKCIYDLEKETVQVTYSQGDCLVGGSGGWNIQPNTVIRLNIRPKTKESFESFVSNANLDSRVLAKTEDPELPGILYYKDAKTGLVVSVENNTVLDYGFEPTAQDNRLRCSVRKITSEGFATQQKTDAEDSLFLLMKDSLHT
jgi:hypothetical protein